MARRSTFLFAALMLASTPVLAEGDGNSREPAGGAFNSSYSQNSSGDSRPRSATAVQNGAASEPQATGSLQERRTIKRR